MSYKGAHEDKSVTPLPRSCTVLQQTNEVMRQALQAKRTTAIREALRDLETARANALHEAVFVYSRQGADPAILVAFSDADSTALAFIAQASVLTSEMIGR
jgi:hypothetical protein